MPADADPPKDDELAALLALALDGTDETRLRLLTCWCLMRQDADRNADLKRLRETVTMPPTMKV